MLLGSLLCPRVAFLSMRKKKRRFISESLQQRFEFWAAPQLDDLESSDTASVLEVSTAGPFNATMQRPATPKFTSLSTSVCNVQ